MDRDQQRAKAADAARQEAQDWEWLLSHEAGRRIVNRVIGDAMLFSDTFQGNSKDAFWAGKQSVARGMLREARRFPDLYLELVKEQMDG